MDRNSVTDIAMYASLRPSVTENIWHARNNLWKWRMIRNIRTIFLDSKTFWAFFGQHVWLALDFGMDTIWEMFESYTSNRDHSSVKGEMVWYLTILCLLVGLPVLRYPSCERRHLDHVFCYVLCLACARLLTRFISFPLRQFIWHFHSVLRCFCFASFVEVCWGMN